MKNHHQTTTATSEEIFLQHVFILIVFLDLLGENLGISSSYKLYLYFQVNQFVVDINVPSFKKFHVPNKSHF